MRKTHGRTFTFIFILGIALFGIIVYKYMQNIPANTKEMKQTVGLTKTKTIPSTENSNLPKGQWCSF